MKESYSGIALIYMQALVYLHTEMDTTYYYYPQASARKNY